MTFHSKSDVCKNEHRNRTVWVEIRIYVLVGSSFRSPNSNCLTTIILGDFNCNMFPNNSNKMVELLQEFKLS